MLTATSNPHLSVVNLDSGIVLISESVASVQSIAIGIWVNTGSAYEPASGHGLAHLLEHMVFRGSADYSAQQFAAIFEDDGGNVNAFTGKESTVFLAQILPENINTAITAFADVLLRPNLSPSDLEQEKQIIQEEIVETTNNPKDCLFDLFCEEFYSNPDFGHPILGTLDSIQQISHDQLTQFWKTFYKPVNMVISLAGKIDLDNLPVLVEKAFGAADNEHLAAPDCPFTPTSNFKISTSGGFNQSHIVVGMPTAAYNSEEQLPLLLINNYLGEGLNSYLYRRLREDEGLVYTVYSWLELMKEHGQFNIYAATDKSKLAKTENALNRALKSFWQDGISEWETARLKKQLRGLFLLALESMHNRMMQNLRNFVNKSQVVPAEETTAAIERIGADQVNQVIRDRFRPDEQRTFILT